MGQRSRQRCEFGNIPQTDGAVMVNAFLLISERKRDGERGGKINEESESYVPDMSPTSDIGGANMASHSVNGHLALPMVSFDAV